MSPEKNRLRSVLAIGGSDCSGGGGVSLDTRAISAFGLHPATAITAVTVQNRNSFYAANPLEAGKVQDQINAICDDLFPEAVKIGMLANASITSAVADAITRQNLKNIVLDPVFISSSGGRLLEEKALQLLKEKLFPLCDVITPNLPEAQMLTQIDLENPENIHEAALVLHQMGPKCVIIKGGHAKGPQSRDLVFLEGQTFYLEAPRIPGLTLRGTGCLFASSVAASVCQNRGLTKETLQKAKDFVTKVIGYSHKKSPESGLLMFP